MKYKFAAIERRENYITHLYIHNFIKLLQFNALTSSQGYNKNVHENIKVLQEILIIT